jgi:PAS domain S-box-containing protein
VNLFAMTPEEELKILARIPAENPNPVMRVSFDGVVAYANAASFRLRCCSPEGSLTVVSPVLKDPVERVILQGIELETEVQIETRIFLFTLLPVPDIKSIFLFGRDITARKKSERELMQMALIARETDNAVVITDPEGKVEWVNQSFEKFTGYKLDEVLGTIPGEILQGPDTDPAAVEKIGTAIRNRVSVEQDILNYSKNKDPYWVKLQIQPIFNPAGELVNFISIQKNITAEKILQQELEENEQKLRMILESAPDAVIIIDDRSRVLTWTRQSEIMFGYSAEEVTGKPVGDFIVPDYMKKAHADGMNRYLATGIPHILNKRIEITARRKGDQEFPVELTVIPIKTSKGLVFSAFIRDISESKQDRAAIETATSRLTVLISNLNAGVLVENEHRYIALINEQFCSMFNIPVEPSVLIGTDCSQSAEQSKLLFKDPEGFVSRIDELLTHHQLCLNEELELLDGRFFERDYVPVYSGSTFLGNLWQYRDITPRKQNERLLELSRLSAEQANQAKSTFLAAMSHEIRTPMNAVYGIVRLLAEAPHLPGQEDLHQRLIASSESLLAIINDILDFSKIEAGLMILETIPFELSEVFRRVVSQMEVKANQKSLILFHALDERIAPVLEGDPVRLGQILLNLVSNAIKFTEKGQVGIFCRLVEENAGTNTIHFSVTDTGIGIAPDRLNRIFESYEQEADSTSRRYGGTGLGLTISRQLVERMGGRLSVESEKNRGSVFHFTIKLSRNLEKTVAALGKEMVIDPEKLRGRRVLIVEDNEMNRFVARSILAKWNMDIHQVGDGKQAVEFLTQNDCDVVLMDKQMPVMGGVEATRYIREIMKSDVPIIALTADAVIEVVQECLAAGMNDYITKPFDPALLYGKIVNQLF